MGVYAANAKISSAGCSAHITCVDIGSAVPSGTLHEGRIAATSLLGYPYQPLHCPIGKHLMAGIDPNKPGTGPDLTKALRHGADTPAGERLGAPRNQVLRSTTPEAPPPPKPAPLRMDTVRLSTETGVQQEVLMPRGAVRWKMLESVVAELARNRGPGTETTGEAPPPDDPLPQRPAPPPLVHIAGARPEHPVPHREPPAEAEGGSMAAEPDAPQAGAIPPRPIPQTMPAPGPGKVLGWVFLATLGLAAVMVLWVLMDIWGLR